MLLYEFSKFRIIMFIIGWGIIFTRIAHLLPIMLWSYKSITIHVYVHCLRQCACYVCMYQALLDLLFNWFPWLSCVCLWRCYCTNTSLPCCFPKSQNLAASTNTLISWSPRDCMTRMCLCLHVCEGERINLPIHACMYQEFIIIISRERVCLTAYTCFKLTASSTKSTPPGVN